MANRQVEEIYRDEELHVVRRRGSSPWLLLLFNARGFRGKGGVAFAGETLAEKLDLNVLAFMTYSDNWYPAAKMAAAAAAVRPELDQFAERVAYGTSMGAYAALKFSSLLGATAVLAFNPQASIDPADVGDFDTRYRRYFNPAQHPDMRIRAADMVPNSYLFVDPWFPPDKRNAAMVQAESPGLHLVPLYWADHLTISIFAGSASMRVLFDACRTGDAEMVRQLAARQRRQHSSRAYGAILAATKRRAAWGQRLFAQHGHRVLERDWPVLQRLRANSLIKTDTPAALAIAEEIHARHPQDASNLRFRAYLYERLGQLDAAETAGLAWLAQEPNSLPAHCQMMDLKRAQGRLAEALALGDAALALLPQAPDLHCRMALLLLEQREVAAARHHYEAARAIDPANTHLGSLQRRFASLEGQAAG